MPAQLLADLNVFQVALVVRDLDRSIAAYTGMGSCGWRVYEFVPHMMTRWEMHGEASDGRLLLALNDTRPQIELIQPLSGDTIHREWLDEHGEGMHHVGALVESVDAAIAAAAADGIGVLAYGEGFGAAGDGRAAYLDTAARLGMIVEVVEPPASGLGEPLRRR